MDWIIKKRGRVTYYRKKSNELFSDLVVEELDNGDLKIRFVGMTGALAATNELMSLHVSLETRRAAPMSADVLARLAEVLGVHETLPVPPQVGRRIGLDSGS